MLVFAGKLADAALKYQCVAIVAIAGEREPPMLLWERRAGGRGMPPRLQPKYLQPMNLRPHILPTYGLVWLRIVRQVDTYILKVQNFANSAFQPKKICGKSA